MNNLPFTQNNNFNSNPLQQNQNFGGGYSNQYNPPPPSVTFSIIEGRVAVDNFLVGTNVTAILADFTNMKLYIKERDANNILKPLRTFNLNEEVQQVANNVQTNIPQAQNQPDERFDLLRGEMDEMRNMIQSFISSQNNKQNNKGGNK